ncbi:unnamed protein product [Ilex paraguariensis]|uniref:4-coumarate--CoA ligase n=1 Tax=Ilex paraguariensis TaxID=185542 RepID=A0ABC8SGK5_9AQUA
MNIHKGMIGLRDNGMQETHVSVSNGGVAALAPNIPALYELHFGIPMVGAVLSPLNTRLDKAMLALILKQLEAKIIFVDNQFVSVALEAFQLLSQSNINPPGLILIFESNQATSSIEKEPQLRNLDYKGLLEMGQVDFQIIRPEDECDPISVCYTSGSTGKPKGVVYSHRAAYLNSLAAIFSDEMRRMPVFLWTVDMFRCNGWCFTWALAALGGTSICLRDVSAKAIFDAISLHKVTHLCGKPTILNQIADAPVTDQQPLPCRVEIKISGAWPPPHVLNKVEELGFNVNYAYGMTEALGPVISSRLWKPEANCSPLEEHTLLEKTQQNSVPEVFGSEELTKIKYRERIQNLLMEGVDVKDPDTMTSVPPDGKTIGEVMFRGNIMMSGYIKNKEGTEKAFNGGWYRTGDLGVRHSDGYIQMKDRAVDMIISGEESISTLEVEAVLLSHPLVMEAAVVGKPDDLLGETPCAIVKLKEGFGVTSEEIIKFCADHLPHYMAPRTVVFGDLPVNSTGKIQKHVLRKRANTMGSLS